MADFRDRTNGRNLAVYSNSAALGQRTTQRKPRWLVDESMAWAERAAGR